MSRRSALLGGGAVGIGTWIAPSVLRMDRVAAAIPSAGFTEVYNEDFQGAIGIPGQVTWSHVNTSVPTGTRRILGRFTNETVSVNMSLPPHQCLRICFDWYQNDSWDGADPIYGGPDNFGFAFEGTTIFDQSFTGWDAPPTPGVVIEGRAQLWYSGWEDRVIQFCYDFDHSASTTNFSWFGTGLQGVDDESWGLDNVVVSVG